MSASRGLVIIEHHHIVHVAQVGPDAQHLLEVMVQIIEVQISKELTRQVADGDTGASFERREEVITGKVAGLRNLPPGGPHG